MANILTVTFSPTIDKSTSIPALVAEKKLRCAPPKFEPGGGGINVARAIHQLGGAAQALFLAGGYPGKMLAQLVQEERVPSIVVETAGATRENLIVFDQSTGQQYRFGMPGTNVSEAEWKALLEKVAASHADYIIASGSLPPGVPDDIYARMAVIAREMKAKLIVDTSGPALQKAIESGVFLLKPNLGELSALAGKEEVALDLVDDLAREVIQRGGCEVMVVSLGAAGAMLVSKNDMFHAVPPAVRRLSTVGAGDSMVAGLVLAIAQGWSHDEALRFGVACGTAATMHPGTELCRKEDVDRIFPRVRSHRVA